MTKLGEVLDVSTLRRHLDEGNVKEQYHPTLPLAILNYTQQCQFNKRWDHVTRMCRGLIYDTVTGDVVARPFPKFFNLGERPEEDAVWAKGTFTATPKYDGSLGIIYRGEHGRPAVATRGSFTSEQALWATKFLRRTYPDWSAPEHNTVLVEIIYPGNRVVVDYGDREDLVLLDVLENATGETQFFTDWPGPTASQESFTPASLQEVHDALAVTRGTEAEGFVLYFHDTRYRVKVKSEDYVRLHRLLTGVNERRIWEILRERAITDEDPLHELVRNVQEEFVAWVRGVERDLYIEHERIYREALDAYYDTKREASRTINTDPRERRKRFAAALTSRHPKHICSIVFNLLDGQVERAHEVIWKLQKPEATRPFKPETEDTA